MNKPRPSIRYTLGEFTVWAALLGLLIVGIKSSNANRLEAMPVPPSAPPERPHGRGIAAAGMVEAINETTEIAVPVAALVKEVHVRVWDRVEPGSPLMDLDDRDLQAQLISHRADLAIREAEVVKTSRLRTRTEALRAARAVSVEEADMREDEHRIAVARVDAARAVITQTEAMIDRLSVRAPVAGTILQINTRKGEHAMPGSASPPILLGSIHELQIRADVDEQVAPRVRAGSKAVGYLKGNNSRPVQMEFVRIEPYILPKRNLTGSSSERVDTRVLQIIYKFPNHPDHFVYVGQQMDVFIEEAEP